MADGTAFTRDPRVALLGRRWAARAVAAGTILWRSEALSSETQQSGRQVMRFFLDEPPSKSAISQWPPEARNAFVASVKVRSVNGAVYETRPNATRQQPEFPDTWVSEIEVVKVFWGRASICWKSSYGCYLLVHYGPNSPGSSSIFPLDAELRSKLHYVCGYIDNQGTLTALGFPVSNEDLARWEKDFLDQIKNRGSKREQQ